MSVHKKQLEASVTCAICTDQATAQCAGLIDSDRAQTTTEENRMTKTSIVAAVLLSLAIGMGPALAQQDQQPAAAPPPSAKSTMSPEKKAISKACSDQANAKGLHGKARKKFRAACKKNGGSAPAQ
jgi:hypothetical protein